MDLLAGVELQGARGLEGHRREVFTFTGGAQKPSTS